MKSVEETEEILAERKLRNDIFVIKNRWWESLTDEERAAEFALLELMRN